ncbi:MAG: DUF1275 family protein [Planctomycetota bacterium]|nr:DUF1275 family protein [Planctomycetota bacterium]
MFVAQAHSFTQQARLAITLAWVAGYTNIVSVIACGTATSHISGTSAALGRDVAEGKWTLAGYALYLLATFLLGASVSGLTTEIGRRKRWQSIYVLPMAVEVVLLLAFALAVELADHAAHTPGSALFWLSGFAAAAMGLQNATITRISSGVVRTTHVTGVLTDLGMELVQFCLWIADKRRDFPPGTAGALVHSVRHHPTGRRLLLLASILGSFILGAGLGALIYEARAELVMFPPVLFLLWIIYQDVRRPIVEIEPSDLVGGEAGLELPDGLAVYHLKKDRRRAGDVQRMPDLLSWADRLPERTRVVILDLGDVSRLDPNSALELRAVLQRFGIQGRRLVLAGLTPAQVDQLREAGAGQGLRTADVCPDLELAIARGLNLVEEAFSGTRTLV